MKEKTPRIKISPTYIHRTDTLGVTNSPSTTQYADKAITHKVMSVLHANAKDRNDIGKPRGTKVSILW